MKTIAKPLIAAAALMAIVMVPGCGGPKGPPAAAGGSTASAAGTAGNGTSTAGNDLAQTPTAPGTSPPPETKTTASAISNTVILGPQFVNISTPSFKAIPGQSVTQSFELSTIGGQSVTVGSITAVPLPVGGASLTAADAAFTAGMECKGRTIDPGGSCTFSVTFSPTDSRPYSAYLDIAVDPSAYSSTEIKLEGDAGPSPGPGQAIISPPASQLAPAGGSSP